MAIIFCEDSVLLLRDERFAAQAVFALSTVCVLFVSWFLLENPWYVLPEKKATTTLLGFWIVTVPIALFSAFSFGLSKLRHSFWRHVGVLVVSAVVVHFYPWFVLWSICVSGLDCL